MTLGNALRLQVLVLFVGLACGVLGLRPGYSGFLSGSERRYGPTTPSGYAVRVEPQAVTMSQSQRLQVQVSVENARGQPADDVLVFFLPSEGTVTTASSRTRGGVVTGTFTTAPGSDAPHSAFILVTVEDVEVTVFVDIVPTIFGR